MAFNSTIIQKKKNCKSCGKPSFIFSKGRCRQCATIEDTKARVKKVAQSVKIQVRSLNNYPANIKAAEKAGLKEPTELVLWFKGKMATSPMVCQNCGASLVHYSEKDWHGSQHHILDKAIFKSIATNPYNHLVLGMWCCHSQWHTSWDNASKMPIFKQAQMKFRYFESAISENEIRRIPPQFYEH
jgi:ribosomal protein L37E